MPPPTQVVIIKAKGDPVTTHTNAQQVIRSQPIDFGNFNAASIQVLLTGATPSASIQVLGAAFRNGNFLLLADPQARQDSGGVGAITASKDFDVIVGERWVEVDLTVITGTFASGQGCTIIVTPYNMPGQAIVSIGTQTITANQNVGQVAGTATVTAGVAGLLAVGGAAASGSVLSGNPVLAGGSDGTNARSFQTDTLGRLAIGYTGTATNRSGTITAGGTAQTLAAANTARRYLLIENPSTATGQGITTAESLWVNFTTAAVVGQPSIELQPGGSLVMETGFVSTELVSVIATTTAHAFIAKEA